MAYDVHLEIFEGPLDLLLHLIKKADLDIAEIEVSKITREYLDYLELLKEMNLEIAGDFLVMASTLMQIKAKMLLPSSSEEEEDGPNPLEELKSKLMEYQKFKEVSQVLQQRETEFSNIYYRPSPIFDKDEFHMDVSIFDLMESFRSVLQELPKEVKEIVFKEIPIETKIREILDLLEGNEYLTFYDILKRETSRHGLIVCFLSVLELIRLKQIIARQTDQFGEIRVYRVKDEPQPPQQADEHSSAPAAPETPQPEEKQEQTENNNNTAAPQADAPPEGEPKA